MMTDVMGEKELYLTQFTRFEKDQAAAPVWLQRLRAAAIERFAMEAAAPEVAPAHVTPAAPRRPS